MTATHDFRHVEIGDSFSGSMTMTETHMVLAAGIFGDFAPLHVDETYARTTMFGTRIVHGTLVTGVMAGVLSGYFGTNATGYLEQTVRFKAPVFPGDTVTSRWEVIGKEPKERFGGGIVELSVSCANQEGIVVLEGSAKLIVKSEAAA